MRVVIIGAGIAGLTTALALKHQGINATVYEQSPRLGDVGAGIQLGPNAVRVLKALGLLEALLNKASQPDKLTFRSGYSGQKVFHIETASNDKPRWQAPYLHIHRADLIAVLAAEAAAADIDVQLNAPAECHGDQLHVNGTHVPADIVLACDGVNARLSGAEPAFSGHMAWRAVVPTEALSRPSSDTGATIWSGRACHAVTYTLRGGADTNFVGVVETSAEMASDWYHEQPSEAALKSFRGFHPSVLDIIRSAKTLRPWGLYTQDIQAPFHTGAMLRLGDAAHAMVPYLAQGAAMAIEDAWAIAAILRKEPDRDRAFGAFAALRRPRLQRVADASRQVRQLYHLKPLAGRLGVFSALRGSQNLGPAGLSRVLDWLYGYDVVKAV